MNAPNIRERPWKNIDSMILGLCYILTGIIMMISFGYYYRGFCVDYALWRTKKINGIR